MCCRRCCYLYRAMAKPSTTVDGSGSPSKPRMRCLGQTVFLPPCLVRVFKGRLCHYYSSLQLPFRILYFYNGVTCKLQIILAGLLFGYLYAVQGIQSTVLSSCSCHCCRRVAGNKVRGLNNCILERSCHSFYVLLHFVSDMKC